MQQLPPLQGNRDISIVSEEVIEAEQRECIALTSPRNCEEFIDLQLANLASCSPQLRRTIFFCDLKKGIAFKVAISGYPCTYLIYAVM